MNAGAAFAAAWRRECGLLRARPLDLAMLTIVPLAAALLVWSLFWAGLPRALPIAVLDGDHSALTRQVLRLLQASPGLRVAAQPADAAEAASLLRRGAVYAVLELPAGLSRDVKQGRAGRAALLHNAQFATHSGIVQRDVRSVLGTLSAGIELQAREKRGEPALGARAGLEPLRTALVSLHNESLDYEPFLGAALVPTVLHVFAMVAGAWALGRELRDGTLPALWQAAPHAGAALAAKLLLPWGALVAIDALVFAARGGGATLGAVIGLHALMLALYVALGALVALAARSLRTALSAAGFVTAPAFAYAGVGFPLLAMPALGHAWSQALPLTHVLAAQSTLLQTGAPARSVLPLGVGLAAVTVLLAAAAAVLLPRRAADPSAWGRR